jgi:hypothetical protein
MRINLLPTIHLVPLERLAWHVGARLVHCTRAIIVVCTSLASLNVGSMWCCLSLGVRTMVGLRSQFTRTDQSGRDGISLITSSIFSPQSFDVNHPMSEHNVGSLCMVVTSRVVHGMPRSVPSWSDSLMMIVGGENDDVLTMLVRPDGSIMMSWHKIDFVGYYFSHIC